MTLLIPANILVAIFSDYCLSSSGEFTKNYQEKHPGVIEGKDPFTSFDKSRSSFYLKYLPGSVIYISQRYMIPFVYRQ